MAKKKSVIESTHPYYSRMIEMWKKYRRTYEGGSNFVDHYLVKFSDRESASEFAGRRRITYCPAHAKAALIDIKNSIYQRMHDVVRTGGPDEYNSAIHGENGGVDNDSSTMTSFIGRQVLPELLVMSRVGVLVDRENLGPNFSRLDAKKALPYMYIYRSEQIRSWNYDSNHQLDSLLLCETRYDRNEFDLPVTAKIYYRHYRKIDENIELRVYNAEGEEQFDESMTLSLSQIPFVMFEIGDSLLTDAADYQIALLNMGSSDINYSLKSNFPFYTEQFDPRAAAANLIKGGPTYDSDGNLVSEDEISGKAESVTVGVSQGRRYPRDLDRPGFIHPSPLPLNASMEKQAELRNEIRILMNITISNLAPRRASAESKQEDNRSLEAGLSYIGLELEHGEREIADIWCEYLGESSSDIVITYPKNYNLRTDSERREEASELENHMSKTPSLTLKKLLAKETADILISDKATQEEIQKIHEEINGAQVIVTDPEVVREDHEAGFVGTDLASKIRGYPEGESEKAKKDHVERLTRIAEAQSSADDARGIKGADPDAGAREKELSRNTDFEETTKPRVRGEGK